MGNKCHCNKNKQPNIEKKDFQPKTRISGGGVHKHNANKSALRKMKSAEER